MTHTGIRLPYGLTASDCARMARRDEYLCVRLALLTMDRRFKRKVQEQARRAVSEASIVANLWRNVD